MILYIVCSLAHLYSYRHFFLPLHFIIKLASRVQQQWECRFQQSSITENWHLCSEKQIIFVKTGSSMQIFMKSSVSLSPHVNLSVFFRSKQPVQLRNSKPKPEIRIASHHSFCWGKQCYRRCHVALESHQENKGTQSRTCCLESSETTSDNRLWATEVPLRWAKALKAAGSYIYSLPAEAGGRWGGVELNSTDC